VQLQLSALVSISRYYPLSQDQRILSYVKGGLAIDYPYPPRSKIPVRRHRAVNIKAVRDVGKFGGAATDDEAGGDLPPAIAVGSGLRCWRISLRGELCGQESSVGVFTGEKSQLVGGRCGRQMDVESVGRLLAIKMLAFLTLSLKHNEGTQSEGTGRSGRVRTAHQTHLSNGHHHGSLGSLRRSSSRPGHSCTSSRRLQTGNEAPDVLAEA